MKKRTDFEEYLEKLEKALKRMIDEMENPGKKPINLMVSVNIIPFPSFDPGDFVVAHKNTTPLDILETEKNIHVILGLDGIEPGDIKLSCSGKALEITVNGRERTVNEFIELPSAVNKTGIRTTFRNGILELVFVKSKRVMKDRKSQQSF